MKSHTIKLKQNNMLCHRCLLNVVQGLSQLKSIQELKVNLDNKEIKLIYSSPNISREKIQMIVNKSIEKGIARKPQNGNSFKIII